MKRRSFLKILAGAAAAVVTGIEFALPDTLLAETQADVSASYAYEGLVGMFQREAQLMSMNIYRFLARDHPFRHWGSEEIDKFLLDAQNEEP